MKYLPRSTTYISRSVRRSAGFTLVEILVVLAIIGILAAILFPVFSSVRASARATACASNLRQIGLAAQMYAQDYGGKLPTPATSTGAKAPRCGWPDLFLRYTRNADVFLCPEDETEVVYDPACTATPDTPVDKAGSYNFEGTFYSLTRNEPTKIILALDGRGSWSGPNTPTKGASIPAQDIVGCLGEPRHRDGYNAVFGDGHVKRLTIDKMSDPVLWQYQR